MTYTIDEKYKLIKRALLQSDSKNPIKIIKNIMHKDFVSIHGPEHHFLDGASLLVAMKNAGLGIDLSTVLDQLAERTIKMPGGMCGFWGMCGSVASINAVFALLDNTGPLSSDGNYSSHMIFSSKVIKKMSEIGGPRCCKRNAFISLSEAVKYVNEHYSLALEIDKIECEFTNLNKECIKKRCPFYCSGE
ncbi:MAG: DUF5714 domain-containing protein [Bacilli bacterium]|nr:DUF5714 domain-containing protein [Bacilli bacterium]